MSGSVRRANSRNSRANDWRGSLDADLMKSLSGSATFSADWISATLTPGNAE